MEVWTQMHGTSDKGLGTYQLSGNDQTANEGCESIRRAIMWCIDINQGNTNVPLIILYFICSSYTSTFLPLRACCDR